MELPKEITELSLTLSFIDEMVSFIFVESLKNIKSCRNTARVPRVPPMFS